MLAREGLVMNHKKLLRLYREENLRVRRRRGRKRAMGTRAPMTLPQGPNQRWSLDFVSDTLISGRRIRILDARARTSARRWEREGLLACSARNVLLRALNHAGVSPERLARFYP